MKAWVLDLRLIESQNFKQSPSMFSPHIYTSEKNLESKFIPALKRFRYVNAWTDWHWRSTNICRGDSPPDHGVKKFFSFFFFQNSEKKPF